MEIKKDPLAEPGVWAVYLYDGPPIAKSTHFNLIDAVRAMDAGDHICFWPDNTTLIKAILMWEKDNNTKEILTQKFIEVLRGTEMSWAGVTAMNRNTIIERLVETAIKYA